MKIVNRYIDITEDFETFIDAHSATNTTIAQKKEMAVNFSKAYIEALEKERESLLNLGITVTDNQIKERMKQNKVPFWKRWWSKLERAKTVFEIIQETK